MAGMDRLHGGGGALQRGVGQVAGMGIGVRLAGDRAQAEALGHVEAGAFQLAVVEGEGLGLVEFQEQLAVVAALEGVGDGALRPPAVEPGAIEEQVVGDGDGGHRGAPCDGGYGFENNVGTIAVPVHPVSARAMVSDQSGRRRGHLCGGSSQNRWPALSGESPDMPHKSPECLRFQGRGCSLPPSVGTGVSARMSRARKRPTGLEV